MTNRPTKEPVADPDAVARALSGYAASGLDSRNRQGVFGRKIDVRANGGYVVAPPSIVAGNQYRWINEDWNLNDLPTLDADWLSTSDATPVSKLATPVADSRKRVQLGGRQLDYSRLRESVSISDVLWQIGWQPVSVRGQQLRGPCPIHKSSRKTSQTFSVHSGKNAFRCFKADCAGASGGNAIDLFALVTGESIYRASVELCRKIGIEPPLLSQTESGPEELITKGDPAK
jgi:hypothetical protein